MEQNAQSLKIIISNFTGNVGKSTISQHLLAPRIPGAELISVESINSGARGETMRAEHFLRLAERIIVSESSIIDVGASNIEEFIIRMNQQEGVHEDISHFIIPLTKDEKQQEDTIRTIRCYKALGVPSEKIVLVFNMVRPNDIIEDTFSSVIQAANVEGVVVNPLIKMEINEFYQTLSQAGLGVGDIENDNTDYRAMVLTLKAGDARNRCVRMITLHRLYKKSVTNLDLVFNEIFNKKAA